MSKIIDKLGWIHIENRKLLMVRSHDKTKFYIPGGKRDINESDNEALIREIKEEITVDLVPESISYFDEFLGQADGKENGINVQVRCYQASFSGTLQPASEIAQMAWLTSADKEQCSIVGKYIIDKLKQLQWID